MGSVTYKLYNHPIGSIFSHLYTTYRSYRYCLLEGYIHLCTTYILLIYPFLLNSCSLDQHLFLVPLIGGRWYIILLREPILKGNPGCIPLMYLHPWGAYRHVPQGTSSCYTSTSKTWSTTRTLEFWEVAAVGNFLSKKHETKTSFKVVSLSNQRQTKTENTQVPTTYPP